MNFRPYRIPYYCCAPARSCSRAASHAVIFDTDSTMRCECGAELLPGTAKLRLGMISSFIILTGFLFALGWRLLHPFRYEGVNFVASISETNETAGALAIDVALDKPAAENIDIQYRTISGTAKAAEDFSDTSGILSFKKGDKQKTIVVPILRDRNYQENDEYFSVRLDNVASQPSHTVTIHDEGLNRDLLDKSQVLVNSLSLTAAEIAKIAHNIIELERFREETPNFSESMQRQYNTQLNNIMGARERYLLLFRDATRLDPAAVNQALDNQLAALQRGKFHSQYRATALMQKQLQSFLQNQVLESETWMRELGETDGAGRASMDSL